MTPTLLAVSLLVLIPAQGDVPRKPHPLVPSLPLLTPEEEKKIDAIIDRFIDWDLGKLAGADAQRAKDDFQRLGPEAFFPLINGFNRAARLEGSCPAVLIGRKLLTILRGANDPALLDFARENIGAGITRSPHMGVIRDLRMVAILRRRDLGNGAVGAPVVPSGSEGKIVIRPKTPEQKALMALSVAELSRAASSASGGRLKDILNELERRTGESAIDALVAAGKDDRDSQMRYYAQELLLKNLARQPADLLKNKLKDSRAEVRSGAAWVVAEKKLPFVNELIGMLDDPDLDVGQAARQALNRIAGGDTDFGPNRGASAADRAEAIRQWREWWAQRNGR
jgi:hypothetical protein